jgi:hypothetical protein
MQKKELAGYSVLLLVFCIFGYLIYSQTQGFPNTELFSKKIPVVSKNSNNPKNIVGNDKDEHGCIGSAGYTWCEAKKKCLRIWEEKCEVENRNETNNNTQETIPSDVSQDQGLQDGVNIKSDKVYFYDEEKGSVSGKNIKIKLGDGNLSFEGDLTKLSFYPFEDSENTGFYYNNLEVSTGFACPYGICTHPEKINFKCDGPLVSRKGEGPEIKWDYCQTNNNDYLAQYEFGPDNGNGFSTGGEIGYGWHKLYIKKFGNSNLFFFGYLGEPYFSNEQKSDWDKIKELSDKKYLDGLLQQEDNKKLIKGWDDFVQNIKFGNQ